MIVLTTFQSCENQVPLDNQLNPNNKVITSDNKVILLSKVEQDPAFEKLVFFLNRLSYETYNGMREYGSVKNRNQSQVRLNRLLEGGISENEFPEVAKELKIPLDTYYEIVGGIFKNKSILVKSYGLSSLSSVAPENMKYHIQQADIQLTASFSNNEIRVLNRPQVCSECPFNNCGECSGNPTQPTPGQPGDGGNDGNSCNICKNACAQKRSASRSSAEVRLVAEVVACGIGALGAAEQIYSSTFLLNLLGPEAPATAAALGGITVAGTCLTSVLMIYYNDVRIIEAEYQINLAGCGCNN